MASFDNGRRIIKNICLLPKFPFFKMHKTALLCLMLYSNEQLESYSLENCENWAYDFKVLLIRIKNLKFYSLFVHF